MNSIDSRGCRITGATPSALAAWERALAAFQSWRTGAEAQLDIALEEAPDFVMAHVMKAWMLLGSRNLQQVQRARPVLATIAGLPGNLREQRHATAIAAVLRDDYEGARAQLGELLHAHPRDVLALQMAHQLDHIIGDVAAMHERVAAVLPAWSRSLPGYHAVLAMHAFGLEETGAYEQAEAVAREALSLNPLAPRPHHVMAHVFEMTDRPDEGVRWMNAHIPSWSVDTVVATHCWWHLALFHLAQGEIDHALALYDLRIRGGRSAELGDMIDAAALLWRVKLMGLDAGARWEELATAWAPHSEDGFCSFNDLHASLAFVGAGDWERARRLEQVLAHAQTLPTRHGETTRQLGLAACRALIAFGRGQHNLAVTLLASLTDMAHRLGGSHAQRDVLNLTLMAAIERIRRPAQWMRGISTAGRGAARRESALA